MTRPASERARFVALRLSGLSTAEVAREMGVTKGVAAGVLYRHDNPRPPRSSRRHLGELNPRARLSNADVNAIREKLASGITGRAIAAEYGVHPSLVCLIKSGKRWAHLSEAA